MYLRSGKLHPLFGFIFSYFLSSFWSTHYGVQGQNNNSSSSNNTSSTETDILNWEPPLEIQKQFAYFLSGYDKEDNPVWALEFGKWDIRTAVEMGNEGNVTTLSDLDKYIDQMSERMSRPRLYGRPGGNGNKENDSIFIIDILGYDGAQMVHIPTLQRYLQYMIKLGVSFAKNGGRVRRCYLVNCNMFFSIGWNVIRPFLGKSADKFELFGTNRSQWESSLLRDIEKDQLPEWLGGSPDHQPIKVYG